MTMATQYFTGSWGGYDQERLRALEAERSNIWATWLNLHLVDDGIAGATACPLRDKRLILVHGKPDLHEVISTVSAVGRIFASHFDEVADSIMSAVDYIKWRNSRNMTQMFRDFRIVVIMTWDFEEKLVLNHRNEPGQVFDQTIGGFPLQKLNEAEFNFLLAKADDYR